MWRKLAGGAALALTMTQAQGTRALEPAGKAGGAEPKLAKVQPAPQAKRTAGGPLVAKQAKAATGAAAPPADSGPRLAATEPAPFGQPSPADDAEGSRDDDDIIDPLAQPGPERTRRAPEILNRGEMLSLARKYSAEIAQALLDGERQREVAVREKDAIKLACIQDRLSNMKLMKRLSDERLAATERPNIRADELNLRHEFRGVEMAYRRVIELRRELVDCVGQSLQIDAPQGTMPTTVTDPTGTNAEIPRMERPTPASPYN